ncbi:tyrosine-type recombinase/integrase [Brevibacterium otitidis]|uniref:Tyrosine-type recombinase/integrase n=2 Tax=Brevibacterium otitidis TaxID=53364 RepID=A0ABV5X099_9MICO
MTMWAAWMTARSLSPRTIQERVDRTTACLSATASTWHGITADEIVRWLADLDVSAASRATYFGHLKAFFDWLQTVELRTSNPMRSVPSPRRPKAEARPLADHQLPKLIAAAQRPRTRMMILLAAAAGLRVHEIAQVRGQDVDLAAGTLIVTGKGNQTAMIPVHEAISEHAHIHDFPARGWWFPSASGGHVRAGSVGTLIGRAMQRAGIEGTAHQLRHWYGTSLLDAGVDLRIVQELMRHESIQSTVRYTRVSSAARQAGIDALRLPTAA